MINSEGGGTPIGTDNSFGEEGSIIIQDIEEVYSNKEEEVLRLI